MTRTIAADYLVVGAGAAGLAFTDALVEHADVRADFSLTRLVRAEAASVKSLNDGLKLLGKRGAAWLNGEGEARGAYQWLADLRYFGQNFELILELKSDRVEAGALAKLVESFHRRHKDQYGYDMRGQPVEITLVNGLPEATAIHWHGMELDSYYDGVHGFSGTELRLTPMIEPGASFVVRFTPPRAGTFMYHTHLHDRRQLTQGLYGAMLVMEPGDAFDAATDHVLVIGREGPDPGAPIVINGERNPQ